VSLSAALVVAFVLVSVPSAGASGIEPTKASGPEPVSPSVALSLDPGASEGPAPLATGWGNATAVSRYPQDWYCGLRYCNVRLPRVAIDSYGNATAVWIQVNGTRSDIWAWGRRSLDTDDKSNTSGPPSVAMDPYGNAMAVWSRFNGTRWNSWASRYSVRSGWEAAALIATNAGAWAPNGMYQVWDGPLDVAMDRDGNAMVVGVRSDGSRSSIWANRFVPGVGWGTATLIETDDAGNASGAKVAMDADGNAVAVWSQSDGTLISIWANRYDADAGWGSATLIETDDTGNASEPDLAMDASGHAIAVWQSHGPRIWANRYSTKSGWETPTLVEEGESGAGLARVAMDGNGNAMAVWWAGGEEIRASRYAAGNGWEKSARIGNASTYVGFSILPDVAMDENGNAIAVWSRTGPRPYGAWANRFVPGVGWGTETMISPTYPYVTSTSSIGSLLVSPARVAMDAVGNAIAVWAQDTLFCCDYIKGAWSPFEAATIWANRYIVDNVGDNVPPDLVWIRQFGTPAYESAEGIAVYGSGVYVTGVTDGTLLGQTSAGFIDAFVRKYDANGNEIWTRQFGSPERDETRSISVDTSGVYVSGWTTGALPGQTRAGREDAFVRKYDPDGNEIWTRQFGTSESAFASGIAVDGSGVYVTGSTNGAFPGQTSAGSQDVFVRKYDVEGNEIWTRQFGTPEGDAASKIAVDASGMYVAGSTPGALSGQTSAGNNDAFVRKYDLDGNELWTRQFGGANFDAAVGVAVDASGVYVAGNTEGALPGQTSAGPRDVFLRKYNFDGNELWTRQFGTSDDEIARAVAVDASGVYVAGRTGGALPGQTSAGSGDAFVRKYDVDGNEIWTHQFGGSGDDEARGVAVDASGVHVAGVTDGVLPGQTTAGGEDAFVAKLAQPAPNRLPSLSAIDSVPAVALPGQEVQLTASASDPDGDVLAYTWDFGDGASATGATAAGGGTITATHAYMAEGTYTVTLAVDDGKGGVGTASTQVTVAGSDDVPPVLNVPGPIVAEATGPSGAKVDYAVTAEDDVDGSLTPVCSPASGSVFSLGTTTVTCTARDSSGNEATATFTVEVRDSRPPFLTVPADIQVEATGPSGAPVTFEVTATDLVDPSPVVSCSPSSGSTFGIGPTTVTCTATDSAGNIATASFEVTVTERVGPSGFVLSPLSAAAIGGAIGAVAVTLVAFVRRRRKGRGPSGGEGGTL